MTDAFVHLRTRSDFTLGRGASKEKSLVAEAARLAQPAIALTDEANMFGAMSFSGKAAEKGIQPIVGATLWVKLDVGTQNKPDVRKCSFSLLAANDVGYKRLCEILSASLRPNEHNGNESGLGIVLLEEFEKDNDGLILLTGGPDGMLYTMVREGRSEDAAVLLGYLRAVMGDRVYVEICRQGDETPEEIAVEEGVIDVAVAAAVDYEGNALPQAQLVATTDVWYATEDRHDAYAILRAVDGKKQLQIVDGAIAHSSSRRYHMRSSEEMRSMFSDMPDACDNTLAIARRCAFLVEGRKPILPPFACEGGRTEVEELRVQSEEGLEERLVLLGIGSADRKPYDDRLAYELGVIENMGFPGYFLIVSDFIKWAKAQGIPVGPGRGSGAGSLVAYSLKITDLDPLRFGLLFERFLNPDRVSMPDFDIDFCQDRREDVIDYVRRKYGTDYVSLIATFGEIKSKSAIKDVGRVLTADDFSYSFYDLNEMGKLLPMDGPTPKALKDAYEDTAQPDFAKKVRSELKYRVLYENALKIEGLNRNLGVHAAGVVIGGQPLHSLVPVGWDDQKGMPSSQFNMKAAETAGLVKFDFLGLKTLSIIRETLEHIVRDEGSAPDLALVPLDDAQTYETISMGLCNNVFQFESDGMKKWLKALKPDRFEDLIAMAALYRPGPMDMIPHYVDCKNGNAVPTYYEPADRTKVFLEETFGIIVYQEQVMQVAQIVAGYSLGEADLLRRAMGKKIKSEMDKQRVRFVEGAVGLGAPEKDADALFDTLAKFADYGFNKSHAAAYALVAYHTAWLKTHYPAQFLAAVLTYETSDVDKMAKVKEDMDNERFNVPMLMPCINKSISRFRTEKSTDGRNGIRFGLNGIKGISGDLAKLLEARDGGPFASIEDFHDRSGKIFNKAQLESLVSAGAFDVIAHNRYSAFNSLSFLSKGKAKTDAADLFGGTLKSAVPKEVWDKPEWGNVVDREFEAVGFYFRGHPLDAYRTRFVRAHVKRKESLRAYMVGKQMAQLKNKRMAGLVERAEKRVAKMSGKTYLSATLVEWSDSFDVRFFMRDEAAMDRTLAILQSAQAGRRPVIVLTDVALENGRDDLTLWGREVWDADEMLASLRGPMTIVTDPALVQLNTTEAREVREAAEAEREKRATPGSAEEVRQRVTFEAFRRKVDEINGILSTMRNDDDPGAVPVTIAVRQSGSGEATGRKLEGRYVFGIVPEARLKATDGVVNILEDAEPEPLARAA